MTVLLNESEEIFLVTLLLALYSSSITYQACCYIFKVNRQSFFFFLVALDMDFRRVREIQFPVFNAKFTQINLICLLSRCGLLGAIL